MEQLKFSFTPIEPLFCRIALYDVDNYRKVSEDFHFTLNGHEADVLDLYVLNALKAQSVCLID
jgi:hypothetical protein